MESRKVEWVSCAECGTMLKVFFDEAGISVEPCKYCKEYFEEQAYANGYEDGIIEAGER